MRCWLQGDSGEEKALENAIFLSGTRLLEKYQPDIKPATLFQRLGPTSIYFFFLWEKSTDDSSLFLATQDMDENA